MVSAPLCCCLVMVSGPLLYCHVLLMESQDHFFDFLVALLLVRILDLKVLLRSVVFVVILLTALCLETFSGWHQTPGQKMKKCLLIKLLLWKILFWT